MKALLVVEDDSVAEAARYRIEPLGIEVIRYRDPLKALDNVEEISPDVAILSARDYPRHWKSLMVNLSNGRDKESCAVVLLKGEYFPVEEAAKAAHLGVKGVVHDALSDPHEADHLVHLLARYVSLEEGRHADRYIPRVTDRIGFAFTNPVTFAAVCGVVTSISPDGLAMEPDDPAALGNLTEGDTLDDASLRVGDDIVSVRCTVRRVGADIAVSFSLADEIRGGLSAYLQGQTQRGMRADTIS